MAYRGRRAVSAEMEDTVFACGRCGAEVVRTSIPRTSGAEAA
jgi:predicted RNA-binding Zn-ribbon protein involved in translation (DUF1610 family)